MPPQAPSGTLTNPRYPTFYACYLLQSLQFPGPPRTYIGSTPNPARRLRQHNGEIAAGAWKTRNGRPWDMTMIVHGFPTRTAALQFEWAWQHPNLSLNLKGADGDALVGRSRALAGNIKTVRLMVNTHPYSTWPLHVKLFSPEAARAWNNAAKTYPSLPLGFTSAVELEGVDGKKASVHVGSGRTGPIDVHDATFTTLHLAAASVVRASRKPVKCTVCQDEIDFKQADPLTMALCPTASCRTVSHITCLAGTFLTQESSGAIIPRGGNCPSCHKWVLWGDIIRGADRRKFGAPAPGENEEIMDSEDELNGGVEDMELDVAEFAPTLNMSKPTTGRRPESTKKVAVTSKRSSPASNRTMKNTVAEVGAANPRRGRHPKCSRTKPAGGATYSTLALTAVLPEEEFEDFSALIDQVPDVTDEDSSEDVTRAFAGVALASPKRPRYL